jgi:hypothetical protein
LHWLKAKWERGRAFVDGLGQRTRFAIVVVGVLLGVALVLGIQRIPAEETVEIRLKADKGTTSFQLLAEDDALSPACGCPAPAQDKQHWLGMSLPSMGFDLDVVRESSDDLAEHLWSLTAFSPNTGPIDWYGPPSRAVLLFAYAIHPGGKQGSYLYMGPASHLVVWSDKKVTVRQPRSEPYAAILPAAGGTTSFSPHEAPRARWGTRMNISTSAPERPAVDLAMGEEDAEILQRGPMVDVLGRSVDFVVRYTKRTRIWAASRLLTGARPGDRVTIVVMTPYALRLISHPVPLEWRKTFVDSSMGSFMRPQARGRVLLTESLPGYEVRLTGIVPPRPETWKAFANRSQKYDLISPLIKRTSLDPLEGPSYIPRKYGLPPVTSRTQIGVFGRIKEFKSTGVGGQAIVGTTPHAITRGQELKFSSKRGLISGAYLPTPLVSSGQETAQASIFGKAEVWIGGDLVSHLELLPAGLISALLGAIFGVIATQMYNRWTRQEDTDEET